MMETRSSDLLLWITAAEHLLIMLECEGERAREMARHLICAEALMKAICHRVATRLSAGIMCHIGVHVCCIVPALCKGFVADLRLSPIVKDPERAFL